MRAFDLIGNMAKRSCYHTGNTVFIEFDMISNGLLFFKDYRKRVQKMKQSLFSRERLTEILDMELLERYINQLYEYIQVPITLLDTDGEVIFASKWIDLCNNFMRKDQRMELICKETCSRIGDYDSDLFFCPNGLMMYRFPIKMKNEIVAYLVLSQFLTEESEAECFRNMLLKRDMEKEQVNDMINGVPILNASRIESIIAFMNDFVILLHDMIERRIKALEYEEEAMKGYEELEASYQDLSELNCQLNELNENLKIKNDIAKQNERRYRVLIERMKQGFIILNNSNISNGECRYNIVDMNEAMKNLALTFETDLGNQKNIVDLDLVQYVLTNANSYNEGEEKKTFYSKENNRYFEIEFIRVSDCEIMVCIQDVTVIRNKIEEQRKRMWDVVTAMGKLVEKRDLYTADHQKKVAILSTRIAIELGLTKTQIESVFIAALLHDIGKISIPSEILTKPDKLSYYEYELMKTHVEMAFEILKEIDFKMPIAQIVRQHHEKINGSGYPLHLMGDQIMLESKIIVVADVYEAITAHRPYRPSLGKEYAIRHLNEEKGILYDPEVVGICEKVAETITWDIADIENYLYQNEFDTN